MARMAIPIRRDRLIIFRSRNSKREENRKPVARNCRVSAMLQPNLRAPPKYGKIQRLCPGFEEFIPHPAHGKPVSRCQAAKQRTGGKVQCRKWAIKGKHVCRTYGGAPGSGVTTKQGREHQRPAVTVHGTETKAKRARRSELSKQRGPAEKRARELAI